MIRTVERGKDLSDYIQTEKSGFGRGGMLTKSTIARKVADEGIAVIIANGKKENILSDLLCHPDTTVCTVSSSYGGSVEYEEVDCAQ